MDLQARIEQLESELQAAHDRIAHLEGQLGIEEPWPVLLGLTASEGRVLGIMMRRDIVTKQQFMSALYADRPDGGDSIEIKIVDVFVCKLRKKLALHDIRIETLWGQGYRLTQAAKQRVSELREAVEAA